MYGHTIWKDVHDMEKSLSNMDSFEKIITLQIMGNFDVIMFPPKLGTLYWTDCDLQYMQPLPNTIHTLSCYNIKLEILDDLPDSITNLYFYNTKLMYITKFPKQLTYLHLTGNQLTQLPELPATLSTIDIRNNQITELPESLVSCSKLTSFYATGNPICYTPDQLMFLYRFFSTGDYFQNGENVQAESTIENWKQSIDNLATDYVPDDFYAEINSYFEDGNIDTWISNQYEYSLGYVPECIKYRETDDDEEEEYYNTSISFREVWIRVWNRILGSSEEVKKELLKRYEEEMDEAQHHCETGYKVRIVNVLTGFFDDIKIGPNESEILGGIIHGLYNKILKSGLDPKTKEFRDKWRQEIVFAFAERKIDETKLNTWLAPLLEN